MKGSGIDICGFRFMERAGSLGDLRESISFMSQDLKCRKTAVRS